MVSGVHQRRGAGPAADPRAGHADPVGHYVAALNKKDATDLETAWPGDVVIYDPRAARSAGTGRCGTSSARTSSGWPG